jgi:transposase
MRELLAKHLVFIDETGLNLALTRLSARSRRGKRATGSRPHKRGKNVSLIGAMSLDGMIAQVSLVGSTDGLTFEAFVATKLVPQLWKGACVVMDNCSIHKGAAVEALLAEAGARLIYLPPYSPEFSPIENCWSKLKLILRSLSPRSYAHLAQAIEEAFAQVSPEDIRAWFTHCCYCTS